MNSRGSPSKSSPNLKGLDFTTKRAFDAENHSGAASFNDDVLKSPQAPTKHPYLAINFIPLTGVKHPVDRVLNLGDVYLNNLSLLKQLEVVNTSQKRICVHISIETRKPFRPSDWIVQLENENLKQVSVESTVPSEYSYIEEGFNELFNEMGAIQHIWLSPLEHRCIVISGRVRAEYGSGSNSSAASLYGAASNDAINPSEMSYVTLQSQIHFRVTNEHDVKLYSPLVLNINGSVCRSVFRIDADELRFDDCVPGGSYVKDFALWNRSEIPLLFAMHSSAEEFQSYSGILQCSDYNTGESLDGNVMHQVAAYGHTRIRVTFRPQRIGDHTFYLDIENLHDSRNSKVLPVFTCATQSLHREGLLITEENGFQLGAGRNKILSFGDCYTGVKVSKVLHLKNTTESLLRVELSSDTADQVGFELKSHHDMVQDRNKGMNHSTKLDLDAIEDTPTVIDDEDTIKGGPRWSTAAFDKKSRDELKAERSATPPPPALQHSVSAGVDSDEEYDEGEEEEKVSSHKVLPLKGLEEEMDDDEFEFDRSSRSVVDKTNGIERQRNDNERSMSPAPMMAAHIISSPRGQDSRTAALEIRNRKRDDRSSSSSSPSTSNYLIESVKVPPGLECTVLVWYCQKVPVKQVKAVASAEHEICKLKKHSFRLRFKCFQYQGSWHEGKKPVLDRSLGHSIQAVARTCTSVVVATPPVLNFGDCYIGEQKSMIVKFTNCSELPTNVEPIVESKAITFVTTERLVTLLPKQPRDIRVEILPRKLNPNYSRVFTIRNENCAENRLSVKVKASNMDTHSGIYHSMFYKLKTGGKSYVKMDNAVVNCPIMRVIQLTNIIKSPLSLKMQCPSTRVQLYILDSFEKGGTQDYSDSLSPRPVSSSSTAISKSDMVKWSAKHLGLEEKAAAIKPSPVSKGSSQRQLDKDELLTTTTRHNRSRSFGDMRAIRELLSEQQQQPPPSPRKGTATNLSKMPQEKLKSELVDELKKLRDMYDNLSSIETIYRRGILLNDLINSEALIPIGKESFKIPPKAEAHIVVVFTPQSDGTVNENERVRVEKYNVFLSLDNGGDNIDGSEFNAMLSPTSEAPAVRELLVKAKVCKSVMTVNQKNINFGKVGISTMSSKSVTIRNASSIPLVYKILKSGSIASNFLRITEGGSGIAQPFETKDITFEFQPSLSGPFEEKLEIQNVQDRQNSVFITIKAKVVKPETFKIMNENSSVSFGICTLNEFSMKKHVAIRNTSKKQRVYCIQLDISKAVPSYFTYGCSYALVDMSNRDTMTPKEEIKLEEELEKYEHKLRIATTKNKTEKIQKLKKKIANVKDMLRRGRAIELSPNVTSLRKRPNSPAAFSLDDSPAPSSNLPDPVVHSFQFTVQAEKTMKVSLQLKVSTSSSYSPLKLSGIELKGAFLMYENQNKDVVKALYYAATLNRDSNKLSLPKSRALEVPENCKSFSIEIKEKPRIGYGEGSQKSPSGAISAIVISDNQSPSTSTKYVATLSAAKGINKIINLIWESAAVAEKDLFGLDKLLSFQFNLFPSDLSSDSQVTAVRLRSGVETKVSISWNYEEESSTKELRSLMTQAMTNDDLTLGQLRFVSEDNRNVEEISVPVRISRSRETCLLVEPTQIDIGEHKCGSSSKLSLLLKNQSNSVIKFSIVLQTRPVSSPGLFGNSDAVQIEFDNGTTGEIQAQGELEVGFSYKTLKPGRHFSEFYVQNIDNDSDFETVSIISQGVRPLYVCIPELDPEMTGQLQTLDFGMCYVPVSPTKDEWFDKVKEITLVSQVYEPLLISAQSNLKTQCYVFLDKELTQEVNEVQLQGRSLIKLYIKLRPRLSNETIQRGECRELFGGVRIKIDRVCKEEVGNESHEALVIFTIKFCVTAGASVASLSADKVDLGRVLLRKDERGSCSEGSFEISNLNMQLPLQYQLAIFPSKDYSDDCKGLELTLSESKGVIDAGSKIGVRIFGKARKGGLFRRQIRVENLTCPGQVCVVEVQLFIDAGLLKLLSLDDPLIPEINLGTIPVVYDSQLKCCRIFEATKSVANHAFELLNDSGKSEVALELQMFTDIPITLTKSSHHPYIIRSWDSSIKDRKSTALLSKESPPLVLGRNEILKFVLGMKPMACINMEPELFSDGKVVPFSGTLSFMKNDNAEASGVLQLISFSGLYCQPIIELVESSTDLGKVGYCCNWRYSKLSVRIRNISKVPVLFRFANLPAGVSLQEMEDASVCQFIGEAKIPSLKELAIIGAADSNNVRGGEDDGAWEVGPGKIANASFAYCPSKEISGSKTLEIGVLNLSNRENSSLAFVISADVVPKFAALSVEAECCFPILNKSTMKTTDAYLPPVIVPPPANHHVSSCNFVFSIKNTFDEDLDVRLGACTVIESLLGVLDLKLLSRSSNTPVSSLRLIPEEVADIRVVCCVKAGSRIPSDIIASLKGEDAESNVPARFSNATCVGRVAVELASSATEGENSSAWITEQIHVFGQLLRGSTLSISSSSMHFYASPIRGDSCLAVKSNKDSFYIRNPSSTEDLKFKIDSQSSMFHKGIKLSGIGFGDKDAAALLQPIAIPNSGVLKAGESVKVIVKLGYSNAETTTTTRSGGGDGPLRGARAESWDTNAAATGNDDMDPESDAIEDESMSLIVHDLTNSELGKGDSSSPSLSSIPIKVELVIQAESDTEGQEGEAAQRIDLEEKSSTVGGNGLIGIRGCTPVERAAGTRYVIDAGQHLCRSGSEVTWEITIELLLPDEIKEDEGVEFKIFSAQQQEQQDWLRLSSNSGWLDFHRGHENITLHFLRESVGSYSTYLIVENVRNPRDMKLIFVKLEIIADMKSLHTTTIPPSLNTTDSTTDECLSVKPSVLSFGRVFNKTAYETRSMLLQNNSAISLEFVLTSNAGKGEVCFSTSPTALLSSINCISIPSYSRKKVYVCFCPAELKDLEKIRQNQVEVYVSCRLVKDFRKTIPLQYECFASQLRIETNSTNSRFITASSTSRCAVMDFVAVPKVTECIFYRASADPSAILFDEKSAEFQELVIENLSPDVVDVQLRTECAYYFNIESSSSKVRLEGFGRKVIKVCLNLNALTRRRWDKIIEENFSIYNCSQTDESYRIALCCTVKEELESPVPVYRKSFPIFTLEDIATQFLKDFHEFWYQSARYRDNYSDVSIQSGSHDSVIKNSSSDWTERYDKLYFDFVYLTDELLWYCYRSSSNNNNDIGFVLADTVYNIVFQYSPFLETIMQQKESNLQVWLKQLDRFLGNFSNNSLHYPHLKR